MTIRQSSIKVIIKMAKQKPKAVTPNREDVTYKVYPGLTFEDPDLPVMDLEERKRRLSRFAREDVFDENGQARRSSAIQSIQELNKADKVYSDFPMGLTDNRTINIFIAGDDAKKKLELLLAGVKPGEVKEGVKES